MGVLCSESPELSSVATGGLHCVFRHFTGSGNLGLHQRNFSEPSSRQRTSTGELFTLDHECAHCLHISATCKIFRRLPVCLVCGHDGGAILRSAVLLP